MATCNILIEYGQARIFLHRRSQGHLATAGRDLIDNLRTAALTPYSVLSKFLKLLLDARYVGGDRYDFNEIASNYYEDPDYSYHIVFQADDAFFVTVGWVSHRDGRQYLGLTLDEFEADVIAAEKA